MHLGFYFYSDRVRPADDEMTAMKKVVCYSSQEEGLSGPHRVPEVCFRVGQEAERARGKHGASLYCGLGDRMDKAG